MQEPDFDLAQKFLERAREAKAGGDAVLLVASLHMVGLALGLPANGTPAVLK